MKNIVTHIALPSMWSLPSLYPFVLDIRCRRHLVYLLRTPAHRLLDHLLDDLKKELFAKMQQNVVLELEKRKRDLQSMVENMLEERRTEMLKVLWMKQSTPTPTTLRSVCRSR